MADFTAEQEATLGLDFFEGGSVSDVLIDPIGEGFKRSFFGNEAAVVISPQGRGDKLFRDGSVPEIVITADSTPGIKRGVNGEASSVRVIGQGDGTKTTEFGSISEVDITGLINAYKETFFGTQSAVEVFVIGQGDKLFRDGSETLVLVSADGRGDKLFKDGSQGSVLITSSSTVGIKTALFGSDSIVEVEPVGGGTKRTSGASVSDVLVAVVTNGAKESFGGNTSSVVIEAINLQLFWPEELPDSPLIGGHSVEREESHRIREPEIGPVIQRRRFSESLRRHSISMSMTESQLEQFWEFWYVSVNGGTVDFIFPDPYDPNNMFRARMDTDEMPSEDLVGAIRNRDTGRKEALYEVTFNIYERPR